MDLDPKNVFNLLYEYLGDENSGPKNCHQLLTNLNDVLIQEQLNFSYLDLCLQYMFNKTNGLLNFITNIASKKSYKSSVLTVLEIIYTLINNFPQKLEKHVITVHEICLKIIKSALTSSDEKVKALEVLCLSFEKIEKCFENPDHYKNIYNHLKSCVCIKKTNSVQEKVFKALGTFAKHFQYVVQDRGDLRILFLSHLEMEMVQKDCSYKVVAGIFTGLDYLCEDYSFDLNVKEDKAVLIKLSKYIEKLLIPETCIKVANREFSNDDIKLLSLQKLQISQTFFCTAALTFFANNILLFTELIIPKYKFWHDSLLKWFSYGPDDKKVGALVLNAFYRGFGDFLSKDIGRKYRNVVLHFLDYFKRILKDNTISNYEKKACLYGFGSFSPTFYVHLSTEELKNTHVLIMHNFEETYVFNQEQSSDVLEYLPDYIQTVAKFVHLRKITNSEIFCLQKGVIMMIKVFPQLPYNCHGTAVDALVSTFHCLLSNDENIFNSFVENTVYQGVVWTCSHQHVSEAEISEGDSENVITVRNYLNLWKGLLRISSMRKYDKFGIYLDDRGYILTKVIDKLVRTMLLLINKLNVSITITDKDLPVTDIESAYKVAEVNDFAIFLNLVDFYQEVFFEIQPEILKKCICKLIHHLLAKCMKHPLISGFYKLLSFCLKISNKLGFFVESNIYSVQDINACFQSLTKFIEIILTKTKQFKGDLLIACLQVLLEYPTIIIKKMLPLCVPAFITIFEVGRSYIKLADMALDTLKQWQKDIPNEEMEPFLKQIIPLLDSYLQSKSFGGLSKVNLSENRRKTAQALKKRKVVVEIESELIELQNRILNFIGQQSSSLCQAFVSDNNIDLAVWGDQHHLKVTLPYNDIKLDVYLDKLLPRIINLALYSTDRKTRVVACELLQAIMMVFLGTTKQMPHSALSDLNELLRHVAFPLLKLGCDLDQVVEQLFKPLFLQLIHWYTHPTQLRTEHSAIIIEAVMEGITHPTDTALRDFSGKCVNEFIKWTIKQTDEHTLAHDPLNVKALLKKIRFYSVHPDPFKKLGAALIFNNMYRELREEPSLLSMFWIEFLHVFVKSLATYENEDDQDSVVQINNALVHVERGFVEKANVFNKSDKNRRVPIDLKGDELKDVTVWILNQTGSNSPYCREKCMNLFCNITPHTRGYTNLQDFIARNINKDSIWITETYASFLIQYPTLDSFKECESIVNLTKWMQALLRALDGYQFVIRNDLVPLENILSDTLINVTQYFVVKIATISLDVALALISPKEWIFTSFEKQYFDKLKSQAVRKVFKLFNSLLSKLPEQMTLFYSPDLWNFVLNMVFNRHILGFEPFIQYDEDNEVTELLDNFLKNLPEDKTLELVQILENYVSSNLLTVIDFKRNVELKHRNIIKGLIVLQTLGFNRMNFKKFSSGLITVLLNNFTSTVENGTICADDLQDTTLNYCLSVFDFALENESELKIFMDFLHKPYQVKTVESKQLLHFGAYVLALFEESVTSKIIDNFDMFLNISLQHSSLDHTVELILYFLNYMLNTKHMRKYYGHVVEKLLEKWDNFEQYFNKKCFIHIEKGIIFVKCLITFMKICKVTHLNLKRWLIDLLVYEKDMSWKNELDMKIEIFYLLVDLLEPTDKEILPCCESNLVSLKNKFFSTNSPLPLEVKIVSLDKLFCYAPNIRPFELLMFLLDIFTRVPTERSNSDVKTLLKDYIIKSSDIMQEKSLNNIYTMCTNEDFNFDQKYKLITTTSSLFQYCKLPVFEEFFVQNISNMFSVLKEKTDQNNLIMKILQFSLVEILFLRHPVSSTDPEISRITQSALPNSPNNKTFLLQLLKFSLDALKDSPDVVPDSELLRIFKCHAYNAMVSVVSNSMTDPNFYTKLFIRQEKDVDILWTGLIDTTKKYFFSTDFDSIPKRKKILVNIRDEASARRKLQNKELQTVKYIESMRVYNSSLSEDLTRFDFTNNIVRSQTEVDEDNLQDNDKIAVQSEIELDCTDVNMHECMANICGLIDHMVRTGIFELPEDDDVDYILPAWLKGIRSLLLDKETHDNIKIFWVKVIDNTMHVFRKLAKWFLEPLLQFIVDKCAGTSINYFISDVVSILASWSADAVPKEDSEIQLAGELLNFLVSQLNNERQDMFKYHLELLRILIEAWKDTILVPYGLIHSKLQVDVTSRKVEVGIHLSSIFLANSIAPWKDDNIQDFCKTLFNIVMKSKHRTVYKPCSETIGLLLRFINGQPYFSKVFNNIHLLLKKIEEPDKYAHILEALVLHYPPVADDFNIIKLLSKVHAVPKDLKAIYLRILLSRSDVLERIADFKTEKWNTYVENENVEIQLLSMEIVYKCLNILRGSDQFQTIIESVCKHVTSQNVLCRTRMFEIVIFICQHQYSKGDNKYSEVFDICKSVLIEGLVDSDAEIREKILNFWKDYANLPVLVSERFSHILRNLYKAETEVDFLGYSSYLLLDVIKNKEEYNDMLFEHPLEDCDFEDYNLQTNWRVRHLSVVPLFAETLQSYSEDSNLFDRTNFNKLRQTQTSLEFAPTQSVRMKQFTQFTLSESSLFIKPEEDTSFVNPNLVSMSYKYRVPKRRFLRDKSKIHKFFAHQEVSKSIKKIEQRKDLAKERENKVTIYRNYRKGDLPDVQITLQAVLEPLQVLTLHDIELSKILYLEIYNSIASKMGNDSEFMNELCSSINFIFKNSVYFNRNLFRALLDVLLVSKNSLRIHPDLVASISHSSGLTALGILLLEEYIISHDDDSTSSKKIKGFEVGSEISHWVKLAELYKEIDEWDVVKAIFLEKMNCEEIVKDAIMAESRKQWKGAQELYETLIQTDEALERKDFYYESYFKCFAHLGKWDSLVETIDHVVSGNDSWSSMWDQGWNQQKLLPWYINGQLKNALFGKNTSNKFFEDLNESLNSDKAEYLQNHFSEELAMLWIFQRETDEAERHVKTYINNFLNYWQMLDPLYTNLRYNKLMKLRNVIDINKFMYVFQHFDIDSTAQIIDLINYWNRTSHESLPSILLSEERVLYRRQFVNLLINKLKLYEQDDSINIITALNEVKYNLDEGLINTGIEQNNFYMTRKYLSAYSNKNIMQLKLSLSKVAIIKCSTVHNPADKLNFLIEASRILAPIFASNDPHLKLLAQIQLFTNFNQISSLLLHEDVLFENKKPDILKMMEAESISSAQDIAIYGVLQLKTRLNEYETVLNNVMESDNQTFHTRKCETVADAYVKLAYFVRKQEDELFTDFMFFVLRAMKFNSSEGRQLFPCILMEHVFSEYDQTMFIEETASIPIWMFLGWIPQLLVNIDSSKVSAIAPIVLKIAKTYPESIMYAYRLSKENYTFKNNTSITETKSLIAKLDKLLLNDDQIDQFLKALTFVGVPAAILLYFIRKMMKASHSNDLESFKSVQECVLSDLDCKPDSRDVNSMQGNMFKKIEKYKKDIKTMIGSNANDTMKKLKKIDGELVNILKDEKEHKKNSRLLKDYCPWLASFSANKINFDLEIPGQYDGKRMPLIQHHVKISSFCPSVSVMTSLRKPIKITIVGNDTKEYPFLIKFGEDVRQDQRIQQLFALMNNIFENDKTLNQRDFSILTYQVVPLTTSLGIIQWIDDTTSLQDFIKKPLKDAKSLRSYEQIYETYQKWIYKSNQAQADAYGHAAISYSRDKTIPKFRSLVNGIKWDILRESFLKLSANTESFSALRNNFIKTYAVMCVSQWILGVGDRHLSNSLVCIKNGKILGIDFGHAFGTATQILPVPELVPFRLTPHIVSLMEPLGERGLFRETMIHCLRSLRLNSDSLLATMNVFIEEPSLDWLEHASRFGADSSTCEWYPAQKIKQAKKKLNGANSTTIVCEDLNAGHQRNKRYLEAYLKHVRGLPEFDIRARKEGDELTVEDQVDCLIDHATDYNLLGRMFEGWAPWV